MGALFRAKTLGISIDCPPREVYAFVSNPENLPFWAAGLGRSVRKSDGRWIVETPDGSATIRFAPPNDLGVLDHHVSPAPGGGGREPPDVEILVPMRVVPNGSGSEVLFTVFQRPGMSDEQHANDVRLVEADLETLKSVLESRARS